MKDYSKFIAVLVGGLLIIGKTYFNVTDPTYDQLINIIILTLTAGAVYGVKNG